MSDSRHTSVLAARGTEVPIPSRDREGAAGRGRAQRGSAVVEASLVLMVALMFLFSIFDFGHVLFMHQTLVHQVRAAARYAALQPDQTTQIQNVLLYGKPEGGGSPLFGLTPENITIVPPPAFNPLNPKPRNVQIRLAGYRYPLITPFVAGVFTGKTITASIPVEGE